MISLWPFTMVYIRPPSWPQRLGVLVGGALLHAVQRCAAHVETLPGHGMGANLLKNPLVL